MSLSDEAGREGFVAGRHRIEDYGGGGFRFAEMSHQGSILATPQGVRALALTDAKEIDAALIEAIVAVPGGLDLLIVGVGLVLLPLAPALRAQLRAAGVGLETMATPTAVRTYNMLLDEGRSVGALLIAI